MAFENFGFTRACAFAAYALFLWAVAAYKIRRFGPLCYGTELGRRLTIAVTIPVCYMLIRVSEALFALQPEERLPALVMLVAGPLMCDGFAYTFHSHLYENEQLKKTNPSAATFISRFGAAWLLFGTGCCLAIAVFTQ